MHYVLQAIGEVRRRAGSRGQGAGRLSVTRGENVFYSVFVLF